MYWQVLILSVVIWTIVIAVIISTPRDALQRVRMREAKVGRRVDLAAAFEPRPMGIDEETLLLAEYAAIFQPAGAGEAKPAAWLSTEPAPGVVDDGNLVPHCDVSDLVAHCVHRDDVTATCHIGFGTLDRATSVDRAMGVVSPETMSLALGCMLESAKRAADPDGRVTVEVTGTGGVIAASVPHTKRHAVVPS